MISLRILQAVIFFGATQIMPDHVSIAAPAVSMARPGVCPMFQTPECPPVRRDFCTDDSTCISGLKCCNTGCENDCVEPLHVPNAVWPYQVSSAVPPRIFSNAQMRLEPGSQLSCSAIGTPPIYIALVQDFTVLMNKTNTASSKLYQEGNYTCVATSKYGTDVKHFVIKGVPPRIVSNAQMRLEPGSQVPCSATGTPPIYIALVQDFTVLMNKTNTASSKLYQEGNYTCVATSKYGTDVKHFVIKGAPPVSMASKWHGYFIDNRDFSNSPRNGKWNMEINMEFTNNKQFTATGSDEVGPFTFKDGKIRGGKVSFVKAYMYAGHTVRYEGETKGAQMTGQWWFGTDTKSRGDWAMWPATVQSGETH